jgi:hypothetical protein
MANIRARRKLSDLYKKGVEVRFGEDSDGRPYSRIATQDAEDRDAGIFVKKGKFVDEHGNPLPVGEDEVQVWCQTPSPLQKDMAMRDGQASRAKSLVRAKRDEESEEHLTILAFLADMSDETLVEYVLIQGKDERRQDAIREIMGEEEWAELTAYQDALREYEERGLTMEELLADEDYQALMELDVKFGQQINEREAEMLDSAREAMNMLVASSRASVEKKAIATRADLISTQAFMAEYERQMLFYSVREFDDNGVLFYESARELAGEDEEILRTYQTALAPFISDSAEAKNSQGAAPGSDSSVPPSEQEISGVSTPETASA